MLKSFFIFTISLFFVSNTSAQTNHSITESIINNYDFKFLEDLTKDVLESSRIYPGQVIL